MTIKDLTGSEFGKWTVLYRVQDGKKSERTWLCQCSCILETKRNVRQGALIAGISRSCGCERGLSEDLSGCVFGKLLVIERVENKKRDSFWLCECQCENKVRKTIRAADLKNGHTRSCGCLKKERGRGALYEFKSSRLNSIYHGMIDRCDNPNNSGYKYYGGRGIKVCDEWLGEGDSGFFKFYYWSLENGYADKLSIDRINVNGNYEPNNCKWATSIEQNNNTRRNKFIEINGMLKTAPQWEREYNLPHNIICQRVKLGIVGESLLKPSRVNKSKKSIDE